jgi:glycosyltransferase involved in cell wall biosynthesis/SAM-dependent methyltransferase
MTHSRKRTLAALFDRLAPERARWKQLNRYYYRQLEQLCQARLQQGLRVLELGCGTGELLAALQPAAGFGLDFSGGMLRQAHARYPSLRLVQADAEALPLAGPFDAILLSDLVGHLDDIQQTLVDLRRLCHADTRLLLTYYNFLWEPILRVGERIGLKMPVPQQNWLSDQDLRNLLDLAGFALVETGHAALLPVKVPGLSRLANEALAERPGWRALALVHFYVTRLRPMPPPRPATCSVIVPCRNEVDNIEGCVERIPALGAHTEIVFVDGASTDGTREKILEQIERWQGQKDIQLIDQLAGQVAPGVKMLPQGKGDAVRQGFAAAKGDILIILDADLTVPPEDLPKFFEPLARGQAEFVNGTRLVYPLENEAMPAFNFLGNKFFSLAFTWLLGQPIRDTLCGTKALWKRDYERIAAGRAYFGDFDPFGDFDLLFGAARLGLKFAEVPVRYRRRVAGLSKVRLVQHGWLLVRMSLVALRQFKLRPWWNRLFNRS